MKKALFIVLLLTSGVATASGWDEAYYGQPGMPQQAQSTNVSPRKYIATWALGEFGLLPKPVMKAFVIENIQTGTVTTFHYGLNRHKVEFGMKMTF